MKYIGVDGCKAGWFLIGLNDDGSGSFGVFKTFNKFNKYVLNAECVLVDIPIGLRGKHPDERHCDKQARAVLSPTRNSSVFPAPSRCALNSNDYKEASQLNKDCRGKGLSKQSFNIMPKIREVDEYLQQHTDIDNVYEMHPEVCFWGLNQQVPMQFNKKSTDGFDERLDILQQHCQESRSIIELAMKTYKRSEVVRDDIVDAFVGAITARHYQNLSRLPELPEKDDTGLAMQIVYWQP